MEEGEGRVRSTAGGRCCVGEDSRMRKGGERGMAVFLSKGTRGKGGQFPSLPSLNSNKTDSGLVGTEEAGGNRVGGDEASAVVGCQAYERKAQSLSKIGPKYAKVGCNSKALPGLGLSLEEKNPDETVVSLRKEEDPSVAGKGKTTFVLLEVWSSSFAKKKVMFSSKKLWSTFFPPSSEPRQGLQCRSEPLLHGKNQANSEEDPKEEASGADFQAKRGSSASSLFSCRFPKVSKEKFGGRGFVVKKRSGFEQFFLRRRQ